MWSSSHRHIKMFRGNGKKGLPVRTITGGHGVEWGGWGDREMCVTGSQNECESVTFPSRLIYFFWSITFRLSVPWGSLKWGEMTFFMRSVSLIPIAGPLFTTVMWYFTAELSFTRLFSTPRQLNCPQHSFNSVHWSGTPRDEALLLSVTIQSSCWVFYCHRKPFGSVSWLMCKIL